MKFNLYIQLPKSKSKKAIVGSVSYSYLDTDKTSMFIDINGRITHELYKPDILWINESGILLRGLEPQGIHRDGSRKYRYQEWFCSFEEKAKGGE